MICLQTKIYAFLLGVLFLFSCSSMPTKEVELAKNELEKARQNQGPQLAEQTFSQAEKAYQKAQQFMKDKEGDKAKTESVQSLANSRSAILKAKEFRAREVIEKVENKIAALEKSQFSEGDLQPSEELVKKIQERLDFLKNIRPAKDKIQEARKYYNQGKDLIPGIEKNIQKTEILPELQKYIGLMDQVYDTAQEAWKLLEEQMQMLQKQLETELTLQNKLKEIHSMMSRGDEIIQALEKDAFVKRFYSAEKDQAVADFLVFKEAIQKENLEEAEKNRGGYDRLLLFFNKVKNEKLNLNSTYYQLTQKMMSKIQGYYKKEAESYLEKAKRLKEEVYRMYGWEIQPKNMNPLEIKTKAYPVKQMKAIRVEQQATQETGEEMEETQQSGEETATGSEEKNKEEQKAVLKEAQQMVKEEKQKEKAEEKEAQMRKTSEEDGEKKKESAETTADPEKAMLHQLKNLYNDAEFLFEKEEYANSIEKAKKSIELAEKMIALKKQMQKDMKGQDFQAQTSYRVTEFKSYKVKRNDYLWKISMYKQTLGKAYLWPIIWFANKDIIRNPHMILPGTVLRIPVFK